MMQAVLAYLWGLVEQQQGSKGELYKHGRVRVPSFGNQRPRDERTENIKQTKKKETERMEKDLSSGPKQVYLWNCFDSAVFANNFELNRINPGAKPISLQGQLHLLMQYGDW